jgi:hypothetical protein
MSAGEFCDHGVCSLFGCQDGIIGLPGSILRIVASSILAHLTIGTSAQTFMKITAVSISQKVIAGGQ